MNKDLTDIILLDAFKDNNCPLCTLIDEETKTKMDQLIYEYVNDFDIREQISNTKGFCNYHANKLLKEFNDPLAHAIIYEHILKIGLKNLTKELKTNLDSYQEHKECYFCINAKEKESLFCKEFIKNYANEEYRNKYVHNAMLCFSHLGIIYRLYQNTYKDNVNHLINDTKQKYNELIFELNEIKRKSDYRFNHEVWLENEKTSYIRAVNIVSSKTFNKIKNKILFKNDNSD